jgi:hypothetical protein
VTDGPHTRALRESLKALGGVERDKAAVQLARRYAVLLDDAASAAKYRPLLDTLRRVVARVPGAVSALAKVEDALAAHSVMSDLGPKYLAVLVQLGLTPASRGVKAATVPADEGPPAPAAPPPPEGKADELRTRRAERAKRLAADSG